MQVEEILIAAVMPIMSIYHLPHGQYGYSRHVINLYPAISNWFFYHRLQKFVDMYYVGVLGATDYWLHFEWQHHGSLHVHGLAWLPHAPDVELLLSSSNNSDEAKQIITRYADTIVSTCNPAVLPDGSNVDDAPLPKTDPHVCNQAYTEVDNYEQDLVDLVATYILFAYKKWPTGVSFWLP